MSDKQTFEKARNETISYHKLYYSRHQLFEKDSWLAKPDSGLIQLLEKSLIADYRRAGRNDTLCLLDLGSGVGRNAVPMAMTLQKEELPAKLIAVDVLAESIDILTKNCTKYDVAEIIEPVVADNDEFIIEAASYDLIAAISVVEHCAGKVKVLKLLKAIAKGLKPGGFARIEMTTDRNVIDLKTKQAVPTYVETPLSESQVREMFTEAFAECQTISLEVFPYKEVLDKDDRKILWQSKQVSFSVRAKEKESTK
ncbi:MAG: class I SAM-dependent methyltransferase [Cyanobacteria bacterium REEB67]|nr:class I SAM-dependent methyltransferase [Cyanobacteria bacterium REEB67]